MNVIIPSIDSWDRYRFVLARQAQYEASLKLKKSNEIIVEPGAEVICDVCSDFILDPTVLLVEFGTRAACQKCFDKYYLGARIRYRELNDDGSLGKYIAKDDDNGTQEKT